jgi:hypothetical protein
LSHSRKYARVPKSFCSECNAPPSFAPVLLVVVLLVIFGAVGCFNVYLIATRCRSFLRMSLHAIVFCLAVGGVIAIYSGVFIANDFEIAVPLLLGGQLFVLLTQRKLR